MAKKSLPLSPALQELVDRAAFLSTEVQAHFGQLVGDADWEVDFGAAVPVLEFARGEGEPLRLRVHFIGTQATAPATWHSGWDNVNEFPDAVVDLTGALRAYGEAHEVPELSDVEFSADTELTHAVALAAKLVTDHWAHYPASTGPQTTAWLLVDGAELALDAPQIRPLVFAIAGALQQGQVKNHRAALESYARLRGFACAALPDGTVRVLAADGSADITFDELDRLTNCQVAQPLTDEAAAQLAAAGDVAPAATLEWDLGPVAAAQQAADAPAVEEPTVVEAPEPVVEEPAAALETPVQEPAQPQPEPRPEPVAPAQEQAPAEPQPAQEQTQPDEPKKKGFFRKLFGR
ncbi:hypothetical protein NQ038_09040 [Brevibacterium sp. 50QC2O2]|uniref:DUF6882 domain-containing protein n=1 Tax=Brevibacterium TaxID=1696 RepID=UPI00211BED6B|nr:MULTISPECIES: DUF6882 domain-containing protein [unclassified Brevibacterium]MCQ9368085.1 hypothetical protein [Brevibacterium sp. 91QC2O2]MCQ9385287.1 hypothetical protein [Brevibacterium sp. 68QC2CO]MCQ9388793.1 hypothetical protein [Brevibacterium sp. 50QC2O2]